jgi:hypothetical protein
MEREHIMETTIAPAMAITKVNKRIQFRLFEEFSTLSGPKA